MSLFHVLHLASALAFFALVAAEWRKVPVGGAYPPRGETSFSLCANNKLCLLGGRGSNFVSILDTEKLEWKGGKTGPFEMHHFQAIQGADKCVWVVGAWTGPYPAEKTVDNMWRYCPDADAWTKAAAISRPRGAGGAVLYQGKIYIVTGNVGGHRQGAKVVKWFDCYDPNTDKWTQLSDIPNARDHAHAVVLNDKLYVAGGRRSTSNEPEFFDDTVDAVDVYDFKSGKWETISKLGRPRGGTSSAVHKGTVYVMGGEGDNRAWTEVDVLRGNTFVQDAPLLEPRHGTGVVSCNGAIWIAGGARVLGGGDNSRDTFALFDGEKAPVCNFSIPTSNSDRRLLNASAVQPSVSAGAVSESNEDPLQSGSTSSFKSVANSDESVSNAPPNFSESGTLESSASSSVGPDSSSLPESPFFTAEPVLASDTASETDGELATAAESGTAAEPSSSESTNGTSSGSKDAPSGNVVSADNIDTDDSDDTDLDVPSASPGATDSDSKNGSAPACFPSEAKVELEDGSMKAMNEVRIGDRVKVGYPAQFSEIYFFSHKHDSKKAEFIRIETSSKGISLTLSAAHLVYVNGVTKEASAVHVGDMVSIGDDGMEASVIGVSTVHGVGLHNPHTLHGDIVVDGVLASTYTLAVHPRLAMALLAPFKAAYYLAGGHEGVEMLNRAVLRTLDLVVWGQ